MASNGMWWIFNDCILSNFSKQHFIPSGWLTATGPQCCLDWVMALPIIPHALSVVALNYDNVLTEPNCPPPLKMCVPYKTCWIVCDWTPTQATKQVTSAVGERRPLKFHLPASVYGMAEITDVPVGKLTIGEALKALGSHRRQPETWTPEKIALDYALDLKETKSLLEFFIPFQVKIIPPKGKETKQIKAS